MNQEACCSRPGSFRECEMTIIILGLEAIEISNAGCKDICEVNFDLFERAPRVIVDN
jgi:hypothetical protein